MPTSRYLKARHREVAEERRGWMRKRSWVVILSNKGNLISQFSCDIRGFELAEEAMLSMDTRVNLEEGPFTEVRVCEAFESARLLIEQGPRHPDWSA